MSNKPNDADAQQSFRVPPYPELPVVRYRDQILEALLKHQVLVIQGETGSGKTTQLPKMILESGLAARGTIGVTQPRRLAALSIADRLREELQNQELVSSKIRFHEEGPADAAIKVMTDGILLQEYHSDPLLKKYSCIMIDEAHERSLNIDILLGICKRILPRRPDFRLLVTSATIDTLAFSRFYNKAPVIEVEGRSYPVEVLHMDEERSQEDLLENCAWAIEELQKQRRDHLLCFLPTERDILDLKELLEGRLGPGFDVLPLFGRMSPSDQRKVYHTGGRIRVILSTNIAETSLTIPGIAYVVDSGLVRISRYHAQNRIQGLPVEKISRAACRQRTGRAGRVKPGVCLRLYTEDDFRERPEYTEPEILRSNLANVVLQLRSLRLPLQHFPFIEAPARSAFSGAFRLLHELRAIESPEPAASVTNIGRKMSRLPLDVSLSRILLEGEKAGILPQVLIVSCALSLQDVRIVPQDEKEKQQARERHAAFRDDRSDFMTLLQLWNAVQLENASQKSWNTLRKYCQYHWLSFLRMREWMELVLQIGRLFRLKKEQLLCEQSEIQPDLLHRALLSGYLGNIARRDEKVQGSWRLPGGREAWIFPGSVMKKRRPEWLVAASVRETSRVFLSMVAPMDPSWIAELVPDLCEVEYYGEEWNPDIGFVETRQQVKFRGMTVETGSRVDLQRINPELAAELFWLQAVVQNGLRKPFAFQKHNAKVLKALQKREEQTRNYGLVPDDLSLLNWYLERSKGICSTKDLSRTIRKEGDEHWRFTEQDWMRSQGLQEWREDFQNRIRIGGKSVSLQYKFDHGKGDDGVSIQFPGGEMLSPARWCLDVEAWRNWLADHVIRTLSKKLQKQIEDSRSKLMSAFCQELEKNPHHSPMLCLYRALRSQLPDMPQYSLPKKWEAHHHLHLQIRRGEQLQVLHIAPWWDAGALALKLWEMREKLGHINWQFSFAHSGGLQGNEGGNSDTSIQGIMISRRGVGVQIHSHDLPGIYNPPDSKVESSSTAFLAQRQLLEQLLGRSETKRELAAWDALAASGVDEESLPIFTLRRTRTSLKSLEDLQKIQTAGTANLGAAAEICAQALTSFPYWFVQSWAWLSSLCRNVADSRALGVWEQLQSLPDYSGASWEPFLRLKLTEAIAGELEWEGGAAGSHSSADRVSSQVSGSAESMPEIQNFQDWQVWYQHFREADDAIRKSRKNRRKEVRRELRRLELEADPPEALLKVLEQLEKSKDAEAIRLEWRLSSMLQELEGEAWRRGVFFGSDRTDAPGPSDSSLDSDHLQKLKQAFGKM